MAGEVEFVNLRLATELQRLEGHKGPSIKDVRTRGGRGVSQKQTHADAGGRGGQ